MNIAAFVGVSLLVIVTPGQDTALTIRNTLVGRRGGGIFTALGVATGQATWTLATSAGVATLLLASEPAFLALRIAGGAYLVFLGVQALAAAVRGRRRPHTGGPAALSRRAAYRRGLVSNLGNPKMAVFFASLLPQFASSFVALTALGLVFCALTLTWLTLYALLVAKVGDVLRRSRLAEAVTGAALVAVGVRLAAER